MRSSNPPRAQLRLRHLKITAATTGEKSVAQYWGRCGSIISGPNDGNRAIRKQIDRLRTARTSPEAKTIKLADLIDNTGSIVAHDRDFAKVYLEEKGLLLGVLKEGDPSLWARAGELVDVGKKEIMEGAARNGLYLAFKRAIVTA